MENRYFWTPGHKDIQGNEVADKLANLDVGTRVITHQDIKKAASLSILEKWQNKWEISSIGRELFQNKPQIDLKPKHDFPNHKIYSVLLQLRTGCSQLNDYRSKFGIISSNLCLCSQVETAEHYLLECELYEEERLEPIHSLHTQLGETRLDMNVLLGYGQKENLPEWRETFISNVCQYIEKTNRFFNQ